MYSRMAILKLLFIFHAAMLEFCHLRGYMLPCPLDSMSSCKNLFQLITPCANFPCTLMATVDTTYMYISHPDMIGENPKRRLYYIHFDTGHLIRVCHAHKLYDFECTL